MAIHRLNHAVLYVRDVARSVAFYRDVLDFEVAVELGGDAAFLRAAGSTNDHDLGLFGVGAAAAPSLAGRASVGMYHLGWEVDTLRDVQDFARRLSEAGALVGASDHGSAKSLYGQDPDGLEFEVFWMVPRDLLDEDAAASQGSVRPLDLGAEVRRYGADTLGGIGISRPAVRA